MLDGSWKPDDAWWGMKEGILGMAPYNSGAAKTCAPPPTRSSPARRTEAMTSSPAPSPTSRARSASPKGERMKDADMLVMDWYVKGVQS